MVNDLEWVFFDILMYLWVCIGYDFWLYKWVIVLWCIEWCMQVNGQCDFFVYWDFLCVVLEEVNVLLVDMLIGVIQFFCDCEVFDFFEQEVIGLLFVLEFGEEQVCVWVVGCVIGEEVYLILLLLVWVCEVVMLSQVIQVFVIDIDEVVIVCVCIGFYLFLIVSDVFVVLLQWYFMWDGVYYVIVKVVCECILFVVYSLLCDLLFLYFDLILCCNVLIYLEWVVQW